MHGGQHAGGIGEKKKTKVARNLKGTERKKEEVEGGSEEMRSKKKQAIVRTRGFSKEVKRRGMMSWKEKRTSA